MYFSYEEPLFCRNYGRYIRTAVRRERFFYDFKLPHIPAVAFIIDRYSAYLPSGCIVRGDLEASLFSAKAAFLRTHCVLCGIRTLVERA